jgi:signal transduction histidine kinase
MNEDLLRHKFILNILLLASMTLSGITTILNETRDVLHLSNAVPAIVSFLVFCFFIGLYVISRKGFVHSAAVIFLITFFLLNSFTAFRYGIDIPEGLLMYALIIIMTGILLGTRPALWITIITAIALSVMSYIQITDIVPPQSYWRNELLNGANVIMIVMILLIIAAVSWLSNREIDKSLVRARTSEAELKKERDSLEVTVEEKTRELKEAQAEKIGQLYRFAEFGRLSSGLFHDLVNPLNAVSLNLEMYKNEDTIARAIGATKQIEGLIGTIRKQLSREEHNTNFSPYKEIIEAINLLRHKAMTTNVTVSFSGAEDIKIFGDAIKFHHAVLNLLSNAIDAYAHSIESRVTQQIIVSLKKEKECLVCIVTDFGCGIAPEHINKIFESFFSTKSNTHGIGIGLSMTKRIIEKDFGGTLSVDSTLGKGSTFTAIFPINQ